MKTKGRRESGSFAPLPHHILESPEWADLSPHAVKALLDLFAQFRGRNNGDMSAVWSLMTRRGWRSKQTLYKAISELLAKGWIVKTRQGGIHKPSLYAVTWRGIDDCNGKTDLIAPNGAPLNSWKNNRVSGPTVVPMLPTVRTYSRMPL